MSNNNYNKKYFEDRDHLDFHLALSIKILAKNINCNKILDVGCGTGRLVKFLSQKGFDAQGCDAQAEAVKVARINNDSIVIRKASATSLPYKAESFDLITSISTIEHLTTRDAKKFIKEAKRVLKPNGYIFIITPNFSSPFRYLRGKNWFAYKDPTHINFFTPKSIKLLLTNCGYKQINFRHKSAYNVRFDWYLPSALRKLPMPIKNLLNYLMISSPFSTFRDSLWVSAQK